MQNDHIVNAVVQHHDAFIEHAQLHTFREAQATFGSKILDSIPEGAQANEATLPTPLSPNGTNPFKLTVQYPTTVEEVQKIIKDASAKGLKVRAIGASHSRPTGIFLDYDDPTRTVLISLSKYRGVVLDPQTGIATVKAGTNLGKDPNNSESTLENSLVEQADKAGWMIPETGGIIHQAIASFITTGSAGGSLQHSVHDVIIGITLVDGEGNIRKLSIKDKNKDFFFASVVAVGLCGIVTDVELQLQPKKFIKGTEIGYDSKPDAVKDAAPVNLWSAETVAGKPPVHEFLKSNEAEYCRILYWPQPYLPERIIVWQATQAPETTDIVEYQGTAEALQRTAAELLNKIWAHIHDNPLPAAIAAMFKFMLNLAVPLGPSQKPFYDKYYKVLPMDNKILDDVMPVVFTEIWLDPKDIERALSVVRQLHHDDLTTIGNTFLEVYAAKKSDFWLSSANSGDKIRIGLNYFQKNQLVDIPNNISPEDFFNKYFNALDKVNIPYATHLGKYRPDSHCTVDWLRKDYPKYDEWKKVRKQLDPQGVFLTDYWKKHLQITD